jgi:CelD/BcsL family acetyltransferase involved in cellulose biosynthesis
MRVDVIDTTEALAALRDDWDAVYEVDPEAQFFLSWTWMSCWLAAIDSPWFILAARPDGEATPYVAFFPLWVETKERKSGGFYNNVYMGGNYTADYTGFVCRPEYEEQALRALTARAKQLNWTQFRLEFLRASERRTALFMQAFPAAEFDVTEISRVEKDGIDNSLCPFLSLPADWDDYLDSRASANSRQKIRRLLRQVESTPAFRITHADGHTAERDIESLLRFWAERWGTEKGRKLDAILRNHRLMLRHAFGARALFLPVLWQHERPAGALAILVDACKKSYLFFMGGRDATFDGPPAGTVLHAHSIRHAIRNGFAAYDFLRGNEPYKHSFGAEDRRVSSFVLITKDRTNLGGRLDRRSLPFVLRRSMEHHRAGRSLEAECGFRQVLELRAAGCRRALRPRPDPGEEGRARGRHRSSPAPLGARPDIVRAGSGSAGRCGRAASCRGGERLLHGIERQPDLAGAYYDLGHLLLQLGQADLAGAAFAGARSLQPDFPDIDASLAQALRACGAACRRRSWRGGRRPTPICAAAWEAAAIAAAADGHCSTARAVAARAATKAAPTH